jgi:hypothetical protein
VPLLVYPAYFVVVNAALAGVIIHGRAAGSHPVFGLRGRPTLLRSGFVDLRWAADVAPLPEPAASWYQITHQEEA